jgi:hypothetical protein
MAPSSVPIIVKSLLATTVPSGSTTPIARFVASFIWTMTLWNILLDTTSPPYPSGRVSLLGRAERFGLSAQRALLQVSCNVIIVILTMCDLYNTPFVQNFQ